jgi:hypothetical protein
MNSRLLEILALELATQCDLILIGAEQLESAIAKQADFVGHPTSYMWAGLQSILVSAANASKILWGSGQARKKVAERRKPLRELVGIDDSSVLNSTDLRNDFEHFDERIERRFGADVGGAFIGRNIGGPVAIFSMSGKPADLFGHYDPTTGIVQFWDNSVHIPKLIDAARELSTRITPAIHQVRRSRIAGRGH